jgi:hypothetical protein
VVHFAVKLSSRSTRHGSARLGFADVAAVADDEICGLVLANFQPAGETYGRSSNPVFIWEQKRSAFTRRVSQATTNRLGSVAGSGGIARNDGDRFSNTCSTTSAHPRSTIRLADTKKDAMRSSDRYQDSAVKSPQWQHSF